VIALAALRALGILRETSSDALAAAASAATLRFFISLWNKEQ